MHILVIRFVSKQFGKYFSTNFEKKNIRLNFKNSIWPYYMPAHLGEKKFSVLNS